MTDSVNATLDVINGMFENDLQAEQHVITTAFCILKGFAK